MQLKFLDSTEGRILFYLLKNKETVFGVFRGECIIVHPFPPIRPDLSRDEYRQVWVDGHGHSASSPPSSLLPTVEAGVGATAAFLISGWGFMRIVAAAVLWRENERTGGGDRSHVSLSEERYSGTGGHTEQWSRHVGLPVAGRQCCTWCVAEGAGGHGDWLT